ncbi:MAG TPA: hypothetical protein VFC26_08855, partial [Verrucomicrobiae bacterium]|nr:hypothetical protein [Verrucomicrobiae bacterium]
WPARDLPVVNDENFPGVFARDLQNGGFPGLGVRVGELSFMLVTTPPASLAGFIPGSPDPLDAVYRSPAGESLFDVALYRRQMPNAMFPQVSGDLIQVSPLMETIAYSSTNAPGFGQGVLIRDPFIRIVQEPTAAEPLRRSLYLLDTQPVVEGATYRYLLVRFSKVTHEPVEVIPTNDVLVPEQP